jgi:hypothetical protein
MFAEDLPDLLLMQDHALRMYRSGFTRTTGPPVPRLAARGLDRGVQLSWDAAAEAAIDPVVPDSLGAPFLGYRLERATREEGPYVEIGRWRKDSILVHEYVDWGRDVGGLKNNKRYYYRLLAFDEGAPRLRLAPMESEVIEGENSVVGIPEPDPSNTTATGSEGEYLGGELGEVRSVRLQPREVTNYNRLLSGKPLSVGVNATSDGARFYLAATVEDTVAGRRSSGVIDLNLTVHGTPSIAGMRVGTGWIRDIFGLNAADVGIEYAYEQLAEPFAVSSETVSASGADVPVIVRDSAGATGIMTVTPYTVMERDIEVEFRAGGVQNIIARGMFPYLTVALRDARTQAELVHGVDWTIRQTVVADTGTLWFPLNQARYYLSGTLSNGSRWEIGHLLSVYNSSVAFDAMDRGKGSGKTPPLFPWASTHRVAMREFQEGDRVILRWRGGVRGRFPKDALVQVIGGAPGETEVTDAMLEGARVVPNPFYVRDEHDVGSQRLYFNNLPEECEIRIYTVALDLVKVLTHKGGSRQEWDLLTEGGELVASQLLLAHIEAPGGASTVKRFAVIVGK